MGDLNIDVNLPIQEHEKLEAFCNLFNSSNLIKSNTCFAKTQFCKKGAHGNFAKSIGKHLCQRLFFNKVAGSGLQRPKATGFDKIPPPLPKKKLVKLDAGVLAALLRQ